MKTVVTERGSLGEKLESAAQQHGLLIEEVIAEKRGLSAHKRLSIYTSGYVARLLDCMRADFPVLRRFVGESVFDAFAKAYIVTEPPHSPSLFDLGAGFPKFLEETKPKNSEAEAEIIALLDLPPEIAGLERARTEVMRARGTENDPTAVTSLSPFEIFSEDLKVQATPCLRLLELKFSLVDFFQETDQNLPLQPERRHSFVAIGRSDYRVHVKEIELWQFAFLKACECPVSVYFAARLAAEQSGKELSFVLAQLVVWLPVAIQLGFLRQISSRHDTFSPA
ncbi:MAG TPA: DNA-binding domain-containing protein [Pyrinomonadaceae bacterium]